MLELYGVTGDGMSYRLPPPPPPRRVTTLQAEQLAALEVNYTILQIFYTLLLHDCVLSQTSIFFFFLAIFIEKK